MTHYRLRALTPIFLLTLELVTCAGSVLGEDHVTILGDGTVVGTDKIERNGDVYFFKSDIPGSLVVYKDNLVIDGAGHVLLGDGYGVGVMLNRISNVTLRNIRIENFEIGIQIMRWSNNNRIIGNIISGNKLDGIYISHFSCGNRIINNSITLNGRYGVHLDYYSDGNILIGNYVAQNGWRGPDTSQPPFLIWCGGIRIYRSIRNILKNNQMVNNTYNFELSYIFVSEPVNDIDSSNIVNGKPIYHWVGERDKTVPLNAGYVALINCVNITVRNLDLANNKDGILIISTKNSTITRNKITNCIVGIFLDHSGTRHESEFIWGPSGGIIIHGNSISHNDCGIRLGNAYGNLIVGNNIFCNRIGIGFDESENNTVHHNNFINNTLQVEFNGFWMPPFAPARINVWDDGFPSGGNYWSDYREKYPNSSELNGSGIWDTPYIISEKNQDNYPLTMPVANYPLPGSVDLTILEIDSAPPTITIISPENRTYTSNSLPLIFVLNEPASWMCYNLDGNMAVTIAGNTTIYGLTDGSHKIQVYAADAFGNVGASETIHFTVASKPEDHVGASPEWIFPIVLSVVPIAVLVYIRRKRRRCPSS